MPGTSKVSVVMPVHNAAPFVADSIRSMLRQTLPAFELIIIDDGSTDNSGEVLEDFARSERQIILRHTSNQGLGKALNTGFNLARGEFIARMDSDDYSAPNRLELQTRFLAGNPTVDICGTWVQTFGDTHPQTWKHPTDDATIRSSLIFSSPLAHPSVMIRRNRLQEHGLRYRAEFFPAEDYDLWERAAGVLHFANVPKILLHYRVHDSQSTHRDNSKMIQHADEVRTRQVVRLVPDVSSSELALHLALGRHEYEASEDFVQQSLRWLERLHAANSRAMQYATEAFRYVLASKFYQVCRHAASLGSWTAREFQLSFLAPHARLSWKQRLRFSARCLLRRSA